MKQKSTELIKTLKLKTLSLDIVNKTESHFRKNFLDLFKNALNKNTINQNQNQNQNEYEKNKQNLQINFLTKKILNKNYTNKPNQIQNENENHYENKLNLNKEKGKKKFYKKNFRKYFSNLLL